MAGVEVVGLGLQEIRQSLQRRNFRELLSIETGDPAERFEPAVAGDDEPFASGFRLVSLYDYLSADESGHVELARRHRRGTSYYCSSAVRLRIYDRRSVVMEIPPVRGARTAIAVSERTVLAEALRYFGIVLRTAVPVEGVTAAEALPEFTQRQHRVIRLLAMGHTDQEIAGALNVGIRTVRYDVAAINRQLGVESRFAAGVRLAQLGMTG